jgi:hypothetical protein
MRTAWIIVIGLLLGSTPGVGAADNLFGDAQCLDDGFCLPTTVCLEGIYCQATTCDPATDCRASATTSGPLCNFNETIDGETCVSTTDVGASLGGRNLAPASTEVPETSVALGVETSQGFVHGQNLPNDWVSNAASVHVVAVGADLGTTTVTAYQSSIDTSGAGSDPHMFTRGVVGVRHDGPAGVLSASAGIILLDSVPEDCFARARGAAELDLGCRSVPVLV